MAIKDFLKKAKEAVIGGTKTFVGDVLDTSKMITEKFTKPFLKGELPIQKQIGEFLGGDIEEEAMRRDITEDQARAENVALALTGEPLKNVGTKVIKVAQEMIKAPKVQDGALYSLQKVFRRVLDNEALKKYGEEGRKIFEKIKKAEKEAVLSKSKAVVELDEAFNGLTNEDFLKFGDYVEGKLSTNNEIVNKAVATWRNIAKDVAEKAKERGITIKVPVKETIQEFQSPVIPKIQKEIKEFPDFTMENNYQGFTGLLQDARLRNPKAKEAILNGDLETLKRELGSRKIMDSKMVDNLTYSQEMTGDDVLNLFKDRLLTENPELLMGKNIAKNLGYKAPDGEKVSATITRTITKRIPFSPKENYYPYFVKEEKLKEILKNQTAYTEFLEQVAKDSNITVAKAHEIISDLVNGRASAYGHLEKARQAKLPPDFYERDPRKILSQYISDAYDRLADAKEFGGDDKILQDLIEKARTSGEDFEEIQDLVNRSLGREKFNKAMTQVSSFARTYNNLTKLSLAAVTNLGDITKSFTRNELYPTLKAMVQSFTKEGKEFAARAGVTSPVLKQFIQEQSGSNFAKINEAFFRLTGFTKVESKLRQISANAGKNYVEVLFNKLKNNPSNTFVRRRLEQFGLDANELLKRGLKPSDLIEAGYQAIADTQPISRTDLPFYWQSPTGKMLTQYKTFAYKQMDFAKKFIWNEAKKGNVKPLLTFLVTGVAIGEGVGDLKAYVRNRERPDKIGSRVMDNLLTIGGLGLATDFISNLQYNTMGGGLLKFVVGPTLSDIDSWLTAIQGDIDVVMSKKRRFTKPGEKYKTNVSQPKVIKKGIYSLPFLGPAVSNQLFPTRSKYKARTIPIGEEILNLIKGND